MTVLEREMARESTTAASTPDPPIPAARSFVREQSGCFGGKSINYRAVARETYIRDQHGQPVASFFTTAYLKMGADPAAARPIAFVFNGGPGSSSQWLHMGAFGPRRVVVPSEPEGAGAPPYAIVDNDESVLSASDLVFIDALGTGYSRTLSGKEPKDYWGLREDACAVADFIVAWLDEQRRWNSPKYLIGESYGTTRACLVADLLDRRQVGLNGIVLISAVLDYQCSRQRPGDSGILSYVSFLPTYAAAAWYHHKIERDGRTLDGFLAEARAFASTEYAQALIANRRLDGAARARTIERIAAYTGLTRSYIDQSNLRIPVSRLFKELLRDRGLVLGRLDARYTGVEPECAGETCESDPSLDAIASAFTTAINTHLGELGVRMEQPYEPMTSKILDVWNWLMEDKTPNGGGYINVVPQLGRVMRHNPRLHVLAACGYYDLATPFFGAENALSQDGLVPERISYTYYEAGHMIFLHEPSRVRLLGNVRSFIEASTTAG
jgi:carboxypeptidase C (cathepsin A)